MITCHKLSFVELQATVARVSYSPEWSFTATSAYGIRAHTSAWDSRHPGSTVLISIMYDMSGPFYSVAHVIKAVKRIIEAIHDHERDEWLRIDGRRVDEPHPPGCAFRLLEDANDAE